MVDTRGHRRCRNLDDALTDVAAWRQFKIVFRRRRDGVVAVL
jgi:hypothetical protein